MSTPLKLEPILQTPHPWPTIGRGPAPSEPKPDPESEAKDASTIFRKAKQALELVTDNAVGGAVSLAYEAAEKTKAAAPVEALARVAGPLSMATASVGLADSAARGDLEGSLENGLSFAANTIGTTAAWMGREAATRVLSRIGPAGSVISAGVGGYALGKSGDAFLRTKLGASPADLATDKAVAAHAAALEATGSSVLAEVVGLHVLGRGLAAAVVPTAIGGALALGDRVLEATSLRKPRA